jgi:hypothetical protein
LAPLVVLLPFASGGALGVFLIVIFVVHCLTALGKKLISLADAQGSPMRGRTEMLQSTPKPTRLSGRGQREARENSADRGGQQGDAGDNQCYPA